VSRFRIFKELKKSLKRKRRHVWSLGIGAFVFLLATLAGTKAAQHVVTRAIAETPWPSTEAAPVWQDKPALASQADAAREQALRGLKDRGGEVELVLHRTYLCGEETRQLGRHTAEAASEMLRSHRDWEATLEPTGKLTMEERVDDLSPQCRKTAFIGMDKDGNLSLYDGPPWKEKVMKTFFQLDVEMLESRLGEDRVRELAEGIRVTDKDAYESVLAVYDDYASLKSQAVPQP